MIKRYCKKVAEFQIEITLKLLGQENQFRYFWKAEARSYIPTEQLGKHEFASQDGEGGGGAI